MQRDDTGRAASELSVAADLLVVEPSFSVLAILDVFGATIDGRFRYIKAGITRRPQGHDLANCYGNIRIAGARLITPASLAVLVVHDELDRSLQRLPKAVAQLPVVHHPVDLRQEKRAEAVPVHRSVRRSG